MSGTPNIPWPENEPILSYAPDTPERAALKAELDRIYHETADVPAVVGGEEMRSGDTFDVRAPHDHQRLLARVHNTSPEEVARAATSAVEAQKEWASWRFEDRAAVFLKAADLLAGPWRQVLNASTMAGQSKTAFQAEIDAACEMIDFLRFNVSFAEQILALQPESAPGMWNRMIYRPIEGFVYAISPFNFTSIGGNLSAAPALMGAVSVWKPSHTAALSNYYLFRVFEEAGLPPGVINFVPGDAPQISEILTASPDLAGIHFTGSTFVFRSLWRRLAEQMENYRSYPRIVGETGGKDFVVAHPSADVEALTVALVRGAYEYQGQKCSAASRAFIPASLWPEVKDRMVAMIDDITMGDPADFTNFMGAVIDRKAYDKITGYIEHARTGAGNTIVAGGDASDEVGYFIRPTLVQVEDPGEKLICEEIFGPLLTAYVYPDDKWSETLEMVDRATPYALTGAVFAQDRGALKEASTALINAAGNFYLNDKPTGAVVGQQPFGGGRASGTNDKAGSYLNLLRWVSPQTVKETFVPPKDYRYPHQLAD